MEIQSALRWTLNIHHDKVTALLTSQIFPFRSFTQEATHLSLLLMSLSASGMNGQNYGFQRVISNCLFIDCSEIVARIYKPVSQICI